MNGIGYDNWASQLLAANPVSGRTTLDVGDLLGLKEGDNPHQWYSPSSVQKVIAAIDAGYDKLDPADKAYFAARRRHFETVSLATYNQLRAEIRRRFSGVPVGYSESIFQPLGQSLGLELAHAVQLRQGGRRGHGDQRPGQGDRRRPGAAAADQGLGLQQPERHTGHPADQRDLPRPRHIPIATVTETLSPAGDSFEQWQVAELRGLLAALHRATGR